MKLKTIKVSEDTYKGILKLQKMLEKNKTLKGLSKVKITNAITYAVDNSIDQIEKRKRMMSCAGGWADMDTKALLKDIYKSRLINTRKEVKLWVIC